MSWLWGMPLEWPFQIRWPRYMCRCPRLHSLCYWYKVRLVWPHCVLEGVVLREFWSIQSWGWGSPGGHIEPLFLYLSSHALVQEENWGTSAHLHGRITKWSSGVILPKEVEVVSLWTITKEFINVLKMPSLLMKNNPQPWGYTDCLHQVSDS